jgi:hypothetical protein
MVLKYILFGERSGLRLKSSGRKTNTKPKKNAPGVLRAKTREYTPML